MWYHHESVLSIDECSVSSSRKAIDCIVITWAGCNPTHQTIQPTTSPWQSPNQTHHTFTSNLATKKKTMLDIVHCVDCCLQACVLIGRHVCPSGGDSLRVADLAVSLGKTVDCIVISKRGYTTPQLFNLLPQPQGQHPRCFRFKDPQR